LSRFSTVDTSDPDQRVISGVVAAASGIPGLMPGSGCVLRFAADHIGIIGHTPDGSHGEIAAIDYPDVEAVDISGSGAITTTSNAGLIGGGFGFKGALEGIAVATAINALTHKSTTTIDTVVEFKAGSRQILMRTDNFEPAVLRIMLTPAFERIRHISQRGKARPPTTSGPPVSAQRSQPPPPPFTAPTPPTPAPSAPDAWPFHQYPGLDVWSTPAPPGDQPQHCAWTPPVDLPSTALEPTRQPTITSAHRMRRWWANQSRHRRAVIVGAASLVSMAALIAGTIMSRSTTPSGPSVSGTTLQSQLAVQFAEQMVRDIPGTAMSDTTVQCPGDGDYHDGDVAHCTASVNSPQGPLNLDLTVNIHRRDGEWDYNLVYRSN
jgi:hypothetical protein